MTFLLISKNDWILYNFLNQIKAMDLLEKMAIPCPDLTRAQLEAVARTALASKVAGPMADQLTTVCCDAVEAINKPGQDLDLHMVEVMEMKVRCQDTWIIVHKKK